MVLKKQKKVIAEAVPTIQPETKPTIAEEARKSREERATECCFFSLRTKGHGQAKLFINYRKLES